MIETKRSCYFSTALGMVKIKLLFFMSGKEKIIGQAEETAKSRHQK